MAENAIAWTMDDLRASFAALPVFNVVRFYDLEEDRAVEIAEDLIAYCRGEREGTDLQLSDNRELPTAEAIAEEQIALESGFDEDGLPFSVADLRFLPLPSLGEASQEEREAALAEWLERYQVESAAG